MSPESLFALLALVAAGAYVQTITGFAMGLIVMGAATLFALAPISFSAAVISITSLFQIALALRHDHHHIHWRTLLYASLGMVPALLLGVLLLEQMSGSANDTLRMLLGGFILLGGGVLILKPHPRRHEAGATQGVLMGAMGGLFGGLFSTAGPPLAYHLYRQPFTLAAIRSTLLAIFGITTLLRTVTVAGHGGLSSEIVLSSLLCLPVVAIATTLGRRYPPPLGERGMRRLAYSLLALLGLPLLLG